MGIKQISVFLENTRGRLAEVTHILAERKINIRALSLADTKDFGVLRLIVDRPAECARALRDKGFVVKETDVIAVEVDDAPGGLDRLLQSFGKAGLNVEYMYATVERTAKTAVVIFKVDEHARAVDALREQGVEVLPENLLKNI